MTLRTLMRLRIFMRPMREAGRETGHFQIKAHRLMHHGPAHGGVVVENDWPIAHAFGFLAAVYWFKASTAKITDKDKNNPRYKPGTDLRYSDDKGNEIIVVAIAMKQTWLNMIAAILTGCSVLFQVAALLIPSD